jgi:stage V sporulation protein S
MMKYLLVTQSLILYNNFINANSIAGRLNMDIIKVSANSRTSSVAGAIAGVIREHKRAEVQAIGAGAVNQAIKALVLATGYLKNDGINVACVPEFADVAIDDKVRTAIKLVIEPRK